MRALFVFHLCSCPAEFCKCCIFLIGEAVIDLVLLDYIVLVVLDVMQSERIVGFSDLDEMQSERVVGYSFIF